MATTSLWKVESRIDHVVDYATDKDKTKNKCYNKFNIFFSARDLLSYATNSDKIEKQFFTTGINCKVEDAVKEMQFESILSSMGYKYYDRAGKLSIRKELYKRNIRVERIFGEEYSMENIRLEINS